VAKEGFGIEPGGINPLAVQEFGAFSDGLEHGHQKNLGARIANEKKDCGRRDPNSA
jgi:hypothetical protein